MTRKTLLRLILIPSLCASFGGCASSPEPQPIAAKDLPSNWSEPVIVDAQIWPADKWWHGFGNSELNALVDDARANNLDLAAAAARVLQAEAQTTIARAQLFPTAGVQAGAQTQGAADRSASINNGLGGLVGFVSYQLDFWGVARNNVAAAYAMLKSARYAQQTVALTVTTDVASSFLEILELRQRRSIALQNLESARLILDAVQRRFDNGLSTPLDLAQQQALAAGVAANVPALEQQEHGAVYRLAILFGRAPEGFVVQGTGLDETIAPAVAPGLPSELLLRRPDIAQAEANLTEASANLSAARAAFFPSISLTVAGGASTGALSAVTDAPVTGFTAAASGAGVLYGVGASLLQTIFDGGRRQGNIDLALARRQELVATYRATVFRAFFEVERALNAAARLDDQERLKTEEVAKGATALDIATVQYREGLIDLLALLQTQQTLFAAQDQLIQIEGARVQAVISLYKALGGGWTDADAAQ